MSSDGRAKTNIEERLNLSDVVSQGEWESALEKFRAGEKEATRARDGLAADRRCLPRVLIEKDYALQWPKRRGEAAGPLRGTAAATPLSPHVRSQPERGMRRLLDVRRPGGPSRPPARAEPPSSWYRERRSRRSTRFAGGWAGRSPGTRRLKRLQRRSRAVARAASAGHLPGRREVWPERLLAGQRRRLPHVLHRRSRGRGARERMDPARPDSAWPSGDVGGLTGGLSADPAVRVVAPARRVPEVGLPKSSFRQPSQSKSRSRLRCWDR
jgi:hypothetical protein